MAGKSNINFVLGITAFLLTLVCSFNNNTWETSLIRAVSGLVVFYIVGYFIRFILYQIVSKGNLNFVKDFENQKQITFEESGSPVTKGDGEESNFRAVPLYSLHMGEDK